ncbi:MAG: DUF2851 family protein, partial [Bacteroidota bacterium]
LTEQQEELHIVDYGLPNSGEGPDFLNARISINGQLWAGNVEMHLKSSDWYAHHHETDSNYDNVILHVVWEDDVAVFRRDASQISTLVLKSLISNKLLGSYQKLMDTSRTGFINCEKYLTTVQSVIWKNWEERLYFERLEQKSKQIEILLKKSNNDWESVLFALLCKNFGTKVNGSFFLDSAIGLDFSIIRKTRMDLLQLESLLFGHFGLLKIEDCIDGYFLDLQKEYSYLRQKFRLIPSEKKPAFFGMRPVNFPTLRLSQLANLYHNNTGLFQKLMTINEIDDYYDVFQVSTSPYWENHFTFGKSSKQYRKKVSKTFVDLLLINTVIPLKFCYAQHLGKQWDEDLVALISKIQSESNTIIDSFKSLNVLSDNALQSQAKLQLYTNYCTQKKCLHCTVGVNLLNRNVYF